MCVFKTYQHLGHIYLHTYGLKIQKKDRIRIQFKYLSIIALRIDVSKVSCCSS